MGTGEIPFGAAAVAIFGFNSTPCLLCKKKFLESCYDVWLAAHQITQR